MTLPTKQKKAAINSGSCAHATSKEERSTQNYKVSCQKILKKIKSVTLRVW
jgi:hypothetical protein